MQTYNFTDKVYLENCNNVKEVFSFIDKTLENYKLPKNKNAGIVLKPNCNNDMNSLIGNSTDLRFIISVIKALQKRKYKNITIAEGPNCGIDHMGIDVFKRLRLDKVAEMYGVKLINLNKSEYEIVDLVTGKAKIGKSILENDFPIFAFPVTKSTISYSDLFKLISLTPYISATLSNLNLLKTSMPI